jgi:hypothetical protein
VTLGGPRRGAPAAPWRAVLALLVGAHLLWQALAVLLPGGTLRSCLPAFGEIARAGVQLAALSVPGGCAEAASSDAKQIALAALLTGAPLLAMHAVAALAGASAITVVRQLEKVLRAVLQLVVHHLPGSARVPAERSLAPAARDAGGSLRSSLFPASVSRRGPPTGQLA